MTAPRFDFHIHTAYLGCANETMQIADIVKECERLGVTALAMTDHLNTLDKADLHVPIKADVEKLDTDVEVYFGVELNFLGLDGEFAFSPELKEQYGFQFAIGGIHGTHMREYDPRTMVDIQHRHHLKTCRDPLVDVLVHPYWFYKGEFDNNGWPWFDSMKLVPESHTRELGQTAVETNTAIEINSNAILSNPLYSGDILKEYVDYLAILADEGVTFSVGSDAHEIAHLATVQDAWDVADKLGLSSDRIWRPDCSPLVGGSAQS